MDLYAKIQNNRQKTNKENYALLSNAYLANPDTFGDFLISLSIGNANFSSSNNQLQNQIINMNLDNFLSLGTEISPDTLLKTFELFEKELKANIFSQSYKQNLCYKIYDNGLIIDKTAIVPQDFEQQLENMSLLEILTSENDFILNAGLIILEQICYLAQNYDMMEVLKSHDTIEYVREDIVSNIISKRPNIQEEDRNKRVDLISRFGLDNYENILVNLNTLWNYICQLNNSETKQELITRFQDLHQNFNQLPSKNIIDKAKQLMNDYKKENVRQLIEGLAQMDNVEQINSSREGCILLSFISRDDTWQKQKLDEILANGASEEEFNRFIQQDAFERQIHRSNFISFECSSDYCMRYKTNNSHVISASLFDINHIVPHVNRKVAFGYSSASLNNNSFLAISPTYLPIDKRENFQKIAVPHTQIVPSASSHRTPELLLDTYNIGSPNYVMYVQSTPELDASDPDYKWAYELADKHQLAFVVYNEFQMKQSNDFVL